MYEDGIMNFEVSKEEYDLLCNTFSNEMCSWVTIEVLKHYKERMKQIGTFPGTHFWIDAPEGNLKGKGVNVHIDPVSENKVLLNCIETQNRDLVLSPQEAVQFLISIFE